VKCGVINFTERHKLITDGAQDGGIDAYFLDEEKKKLYLIQSKFRNTSDNFEEKSINADDLVKMEIGRILKGYKTDSRGIEFNSKILDFQSKWGKISDPAHYEYIVVILGNLRNYSEEQVKRLIENSSFIIFDFQKAYDELVFPLCSGTFYDPDEIQITINLKGDSTPALKQKILTNFGLFQIWIVYVPTKEIGRIMSKYKNSILKFNPRNYLSLSRNEVNKNIRDSIMNLDTNDFALLNNGITILCESFDITEKTGVIDIGQIIIKTPQIVNGGQTAYTLSKIYEDNYESLDKTFGDKEVLLKAIVTKTDTFDNLKFTEEISNATNKQSRVEEADRRSNDKIQVQIQEKIYKEFGYYYERKRGEFYYGLDIGYISKNLIIDRSDFLRAYYAFTGEPRWARQRGSEKLFTTDYFHSIFTSSDDYKVMFYSYLLLVELYRLEKENDESWGYGLRYGKMAIISALGVIGLQQEITQKNINFLVISAIENIKKRWQEFEEFAKNKNSQDLQPNNFDYDNYYKGKSISNDVAIFFKK